MKNRLRLVVVEPHNAGGLVHYAYQLCTAIADAGVDVTLVTGTGYELTDFSHNFRVEKLLRLWANIDQQPLTAQYQNSLMRDVSRRFRIFRRALRAIRLFWAWMRLTDFLVKLGPDVIQFTRIEFPFEAFFLKYLHWRGLVLTQICHEFESRESPGLLSHLATRLTRAAYSNFSAIFFHASEYRNRFLQIYPNIPISHTHIIPHGNSRWLLDVPARSKDSLRRQYGLKKGERIVLFFGLLAPSKGVEVLIDAFAIASHNCSAKLLIAGYPTKHINLSELQERARSRSITDRVIFDPRYIPLDEIRPLMELSSVAVYPYHSSTQSGALQAAYIFGRPVIATAVGGLPEAVENGRSGFLVSPGSSQELAETLIAVINNPELARQMGEHARHLAYTRFSWQTIAGQIIVVYDNLVNRGPDPTQS